MKLDELIEALAGEIELACPRLELSLGRLAVLEVDDESFLAALDEYSGQAQRMGEAAEMVGFPGLGAVCSHVVDNALLLATMAPAKRAPLLDFLREWTPLILQYLRDLSDPSTAAGLIDHLRGAPSPMDEDQALKVMHMLGAMPARVAPPGTGDSSRQRPVLATPEDVALSVACDIDSQLLEGFMHEAPEQARHLVEFAQKMASGEGEASDLVTAKRVVHTLKGSGSIIGLRGLAVLGHHVEDIFEHVERRGVDAARPIADALIDAAYCLEQMVGYVVGGEAFPDQAQGVLQAVLDLANRIDRGESLDTPIVRVPAMGAAPMSSVPLATSSGVQGAAVSPGTSIGAAALRVSVARVDELLRISGEVSVHNAAMEVRIKALSEHARELLAQNLRVQKRLFELETLVDVRALALMRSRTSRADGATFDPLEMDQYSELHSAAHALFEESADARALASRLEEEIAQTAGVQTRQQRLSKELQHLVAATRMAEVRTIESRLQRNVRSTCQSTGKQAMLELRGSDTLIDSDVLNRLVEPLMHVLRNAVDHGLEAPDERARLGKAGTGRIVLSFARQGQQVVLRCQDDGRGLDYAAIRLRAAERGLLAAGQLMGDDELARLILAPGFSTRDSVTEVSGRGVGLDVVREWIRQVNGSIRIESEPGRGCCIELRFAASMSTLHALIVELGGQRFSLPSVQVERAAPAGIGRFEALGGQLNYHLERQVYPALRLADAVGMPTDADEATDHLGAVIVRLEEKTFALAVDRLVDARELLVKSPGRYARHLRGIAGLSILGDGSIAANLDLAQLLAGAAPPRAARTSTAARAPTHPQLPGVLIVDDALSVRNSLLQLMRDSGFRAEAARDGLEAIAALRSFRPDVLLTDLEMPNMNGIELATHVRGRDDLRRLPVFMITSRSQDKHRELAAQAGVDKYFTKPYNESELLQTIRRALEA